jgi:hypothetical protein
MPRHREMGARIREYNKTRRCLLSDLKAVFETIAATNHWGSSESVSGAGSTIAYTYNLRHELALFTRKFDVKSFFDAPCGDFNWMKETDFPANMRYLGGDIVAPLIEADIRKYGSATRGFVEFDITRDPFPDADVWFCRDCLFHLPFEMIFRALDGFCRSQIPYVMMTNHLNTTRFQNRDIEAGDFRLLDFHLEPFDLPRDVLYQIPDYVYPFPRRELCVWSRAQIAAALSKRAPERGGNRDAPDYIS